MFEGFIDEVVPVNGTTSFVRHAGSGPAVVLLHGHPRTSATWHRVAPALAEAGFSVVCTDLRGYGRSGKPPTDASHAPYSKRATASDIAAVMRHLGHERYAVVGHDRGSYVALRLALDEPQRVTRLAVLDGVPISEALERAGASFATAWWHWFFYAQPEVPERVINADPDAWYHVDCARMSDPAYAEWVHAVRDPATVHAMLEDYRAGLGIDFRDEIADRTTGLSCPTLHLWAQHDDLPELYGDPLAVWARWAPDLSGHAIDSGHHMAEEAPDEVVDALLSFLQPDDADTRARHGYGSSA